MINTGPLQVSGHKLQLRAPLTRYQIVRSYSSRAILTLSSYRYYYMTAMSSPGRQPHDSRLGALSPSGPPRTSYAINSRSLSEPTTHELDIQLFHLEGRAQSDVGTPSKASRERYASSVRPILDPHSIDRPSRNRTTQSRTCTCVGFPPLDQSWASYSPSCLMVHP